MAKRQVVCNGHRFCTNCHAELSDAARRCAECGTEHPQTAHETSFALEGTPYGAPPAVQVRYSTHQPWTEAVVARVRAALTPQGVVLTVHDARDRPVATVILPRPRQRRR